jgi:tmRNA-binding protein
VFLAHGYAKVEIAFAKGKQLHDKRAAIKERDLGPEDDPNSPFRRRRRMNMTYSLKSWIILKSAT